MVIQCKDAGGRLNMVSFAGKSNNTVVLREDIFFCICIRHLVTRCLLGKRKYAMNS
jgi:hypothetical protein